MCLEKKVQILLEPWFQIKTYFIEKTHATKSTKSQSTIFILLFISTFSPLTHFPLY